MLNVVIDLEMCKVPKHYKTDKYKRSQETIQIGAAFFNEDWQQIETFSRFVHPEHGVIDTEIRKLTNIDNKDTKKAEKLREALLDLIERIGKREYILYEWSNSDRKQLEYEIRAKEISDESIQILLEESHWVNYQVVYMERFGCAHSPSLESVLNRVGITTEGHQHDGLDDAINTGKLIGKLENDKEYALPEIESYSDTCGCFGNSFASIFAKLGLQ